MAEDKQQRKGKIFLIVGLILFGVFALIYWLIGIRGLMQIIQWIFIILFILIILGLVFWLIWFLFFKKQKFDVTYVNKQKLMDACHKGVTGLMKTLYLSGDKGHSRVAWGKITGYCRISVLTRELKTKLNEKNGVYETVQVKNKHGDLEDVWEYGKEEQDVFSISHKGWFGSFFEEEDIVRVSPRDHDELVGDVTLYGYSLLSMSEYWFLNIDLLDVRKIDYAILKEAERGIMFEMLRDVKEIVDKASGLDTLHQKKLEEKSLLEIPMNMGGGK